MSFYKSRFVKVGELGYTILMHFVASSDTELFRDVKCTSDVNKNVELQFRTQLAFFQVVFQVLKTRGWRNSDNDRIS